MLQLIRKIFKDPTDHTKISLIFANRTKSDILFKADLDELQSKYPDQFQVYYVLDKTPWFWSGGKGFITKDIISDHMPSPANNKAMTLICGPTKMYELICGDKSEDKSQGPLKGLMKELGYGKEAVYKF